MRAVDRRLVFASLIGPSRREAIMSLSGQAARYKGKIATKLSVPLHLEIWRLRAW
jgi:hypothetical protein